MAGAPTERAPRGMGGWPPASHAICGMSVRLEEHMPIGTSAVRRCIHAAIAGGLDEVHVRSVARAELTRR